MKLLVINGPNMNLLGIRDPNIYGKDSFADLESLIRNTCAELGIEVKLFQSNHEGAILDEIHAARGTQDAILINPAAYTHTSIAIMDALKAVSLPAVEVHLADPKKREPFRHRSYAGTACIKSITGQGIEGYRQGILHLKAHLEG